ncbi:ribbon-helix-helix domain-containing protein [Methylobacterium sp. Leaf118]|uniref:ribbon-helix-helix domain-containing protein n=1 Tax=Methylobacterium sp. Leaf118 TaxID=2876562 RepID=UPI001E4B9E1E|nr:type II toxin-antitoxin system ParD family antitoxin [Methylobacterium sp. Leaf118]
MSKPVVLTPENAAFVDDLVAAGRDASTDAAVLEGIRLVRLREARLVELRTAWAEGVESGHYEPVEDVLDARYGASETAGS